MATLATEPRWTHAAQALVDGLVDLHDDEDRVALLAVVCEGLGDELYPAFLRLLSTIGRHGDHAACAAVARALVHALRTGRLPSGRRSAWGAAACSEPGYAMARHLGPLEYLCAWHSQAEPALALPSSEFHTAARALMDLVASSREARLLYCEKLIADADDPLAATLTRRTRAALRALATAWAGGADSAAASGCFLTALSALPALGAFPTAEGPNGSR
jgi:hypothetical protein